MPDLHEYYLLARCLALCHSKFPHTDFYPGCWFIQVSSYIPIYRAPKKKKLRSLTRWWYYCHKANTLRRIWRWPCQHSSHCTRKQSIQPRDKRRCWTNESYRCGRWLTSLGVCAIDGRSQFPTHTLELQPVDIRAIRYHWKISNLGCHDERIDLIRCRSTSEIPDRYDTPIPIRLEEVVSNLPGRKFRVGVQVYKLGKQVESSVLARIEKRGVLLWQTRQIEELGQRPCRTEQSSKDNICMKSLIWTHVYLSPAQV